MTHDTDHSAPSRRSLRRFTLSRRVAAVLLFAGLSSLPLEARSNCNVIPQPETAFRGQTASLNRVFASPGDPLRISLDTAGCDAGSPGFAAGGIGETITTFESGTLEGWTSVGAHASFDVEDNGATLWSWALNGRDGGSGGALASARAPSAYLGNWIARGVTQLRWDHWTDAGGFGFPPTPLLSGSQDLIRLSGPGGSAAWRKTEAFIASQTNPNNWGNFVADIDTATPQGGWIVTSGTWVALMADVTDVVIQGELGQASDDDYRLDNVELRTRTTGSVTTLLYEPPAAAANAVVIPSGGFGSCAILATELAACTSQLGGGTVTCRDDIQVSVQADSLSLPLPDQGFTGPVTVAVSLQGASLPCALATTQCGGPGAPSGLLACIDTFYAIDGTCASDVANEHRNFPGLTALPPPNDFQQICTASHPSVQCNNSGDDVQFTTDADGNVVVPIDWRGVLVQPRTLPIPRLVQLTSSIAAFTGMPPEANQTPGAPVSVPGQGFLQSFSPKGLRVDPLFTPLVDPQSIDTDLFGSADAEFGVIRVLRRSPVFRECLAGDRGGLACTADAECPASTCTQALCRGGANDGKLCAGDSACPSGECGPANYDFSDRYTNGGTGPVVITAADYDAAASNPVAIEALAQTGEVFGFVRSERLEQIDLNLDGDSHDDTIIDLKRLDNAESADIARRVGGTGRASARVRDGLFRFPPLAVEDDIVAFLEAERWEAASLSDIQNGDGDFFDMILRIFRVEPDGAATELTAGPGLAADPAPLVAGRSVLVSDGLVFYRESEPAGASWTSDNKPFLGGEVQFSADGRWLLHVDEGSDLLFVYDRDDDLDGILDEGFVRVAVGVDSAGTAIPGDYRPRGLSGDGRFALFQTDAAGLVPGDTNGAFDLFIHDRDADMDGIFDEPGAIATIRIAEFSGGPAQMSADGRWVTFSSSTITFPGDTSSRTRLIMHDRDADEDGIFDEPGATATYRALDSILAPGFANNVDISNRPYALTLDGRYLLFDSSASNIVAGDVNGQTDMFLLDRDVDEDGVFDEPGETAVFSPSIASKSTTFSRPTDVSEDGRVIMGYEGSGNAVIYDRDGNGNGIFDEPGDLVREEVGLSTIGIDRPTRGGKLSSDGRYAIIRPFYEGSHPVGGFAAQFLDRVTSVFHFFLDGLGSAIPTSTRGEIHADAQTIFHGRVLPGGRWLRKPDLDGASNDLNGDGDSRDFVLAVVDTDQPFAVTYLAPADQVAVAAGHAVFLQPESAQGAGIDLNGDGDTDDRVVQRYLNRGTTTNLGLAADQVALSEQVIAALASEAGEGADLNGDGDLLDRVVHVNELTGSAGSWVNLGIAADDIQVRGPWVAFTAVESAQGSSLNGDGDTQDRVLLVYNAQTGQYLDLQDELGTMIPGLAVDDFVLGDEVVAFRVNEADQGAGSLNDVVPPIPGGVGDTDTADSVLHVADLATGIVYNSMQAAIPCPTEACDPRIPYRVLGSKVTFLTLESQQGDGGGNDLDQSGGPLNVVLQHFNAAALAVGGDMEDAGDLLGGSMAGFCTTTGASCASDLDCAGADTCYLPPGGCVADTGVSCSPEAPGTVCASGEFCGPVLGVPGSFTCQSVTGPCLTDNDCTAPEVCFEDSAKTELLFSSLRDDPDGRQRYVTRGLCSDGDGSCDNSDQCNAGVTCDLDVTVIATAADPDRDGLSDNIDNCPDVTNPDQRDTDGDGIGDACDRETCGNGIQEYSEECDHGDQNGLDGVCSSECSYVGAATACSDGIDNDGDGLVDYPDDPGCENAADTSERSALLPCDDGIDNDGDYGVDYPDDLGCRDPLWPFEDPQCQNGIDDDGDGKIDFDGGASLNGGVPLTEPDPQCTEPWRNREQARSCGLGFELALLLGALAARSARVRQRRAALTS